MKPSGGGQNCKQKSKSGSDHLLIKLDEERNEYRAVLVLACIVADEL
jgi:hypothetical protein